MNTKADYVDIELIVNQRGDKFVGVGFGEGLEETQKVTKDRATNPPKINIIKSVTSSVSSVEGNSVGEAIVDIIDGATDKYLNWKTFEFVGSTEAGALVLWMVKDDKGVYHATRFAWQQIGGYNDLYDNIFDWGTDMLSAKFEFSSEGRNYIFWAWKGDYVNLGAGAELGIYSNESGILGLVNIKSPHSEHWLVDTKLAMPMTMRIILKENNTETEIATYSPHDKQWWITSFNPSYKNKKAKDLTVTFTVDFTGQNKMYSAFKKEIKDTYKDRRWTFTDDQGEDRLGARFVF